MMLTINQPIPYGYRPVHDLPTPPRSSPPVTILDFSQKALQQQQQQSPPIKPMSAPHRGLPPPAAMTLAQPPPPHGPPHPPTPSSVLQAQAPPAPSPLSQALGPLPPPPQWQGSEDSMRNWLLAKAEEEKRRQEEEKTRQESLRLEQRRIEHDILRTSLERGIPPPMVPLIFAGMSGGILPQATLEWVQQFLPLPHQPHHGQILPAHGPMSPDHRRDSQQYGSYAGSAGVPPTPGSGTQAGFVSYQGSDSPTRARAHTVSFGTAAGRPLGGLGSSALPRLSTGTGDGGSGPSHAPHTATQQQQQQQQQGAVTQQDTHPLYFHHWQPPTSTSSSSQQAASSGSSKSKNSK